MQTTSAVFVSRRTNLFAVNPRLHPVLAAVIVEMTELNRHRRAPDLPSLFSRLENYREQTADMDVARLPGFADAGLAGRRGLVLAHLRDRLFDISRRNRLLYFKPTQASLNLHRRECTDRDEPGQHPAGATLCLAPSAGQGSQSAAAP